MSLAIDVDKVGGVLLADGWHKVRWQDGRSTFDIDAYEYVREWKTKSAILYSAASYELLVKGCFTLLSF